MPYCPNCGAFMVHRQTEIGHGLVCSVDPKHGTYRIIDNMTLETYTYPDRAHETVESLHRRCQALKRAARSPTLETSQDQKCPKCDVFVKIGRDGTGEAILVCPGCRELIKPEFQF